MFGCVVGIFSNFTYVWSPSTRSDDKICFVFYRIHTHVCRRYFQLYNILINLANRQPHRMEWWRVFCIVWCCRFRCTLSSAVVSFSSENNKKTFENVAVYGGTRRSEAKTPKTETRKVYLFCSFWWCAIYIVHNFPSVTLAGLCVGDGCAEVENKVCPQSPRWTSECRSFLCANKWWRTIQTGRSEKYICLDATHWQLN